MIDCEKCDIWDIEEDEENEEKDEFVIDSDKLAEWAVKQIRKETEECDRLVELAKAEIAELNKKIEQSVSRCESSTGYLKGKLLEYFNTVEHKETKTQETYKLLSGSLIFKKPAQKMSPDKDKLLAYVKANDMPEFVKVKEEVDWAGYKKECEIVDGKVVNTQTGDLLPEDVITVEEVPGQFDVKF